MDIRNSVRKVLSFAAVGFHGREWWTRTAACVLLFLPPAAPSAQVTDNHAALALRTLIARRDPMLDVVESGDALMVLGPESVALYSRADAIDGAPAVSTAPITHMRPWPRDVRGSLRVDGARYDAFLPGVVCHGTLHPLTTSCVDENAAWPVELENAGVMPSRNYFATPEGLIFYAVAPLAPAQSPKWLVVDASGSLAFLDERRRVISRGEAADDVARLESGCSPLAFVVTVGHTTPLSARDDVRLRSVGAGTTLVDVDEVTFAGAVTALWARPGSRVAIAIVRHGDGTRYEAHQISVACAR